MNKNLIIVGIIVFIVVGSWFLSGYNSQTGNVGGGDGFIASSCTTGTSTAVAIGHQYSEDIIGTSSRRAFVSIQQPVNATNTVSISLRQGARAVTNHGTSLHSAIFGTTTQPFIVGLNTDLPYTGTITARTNAGSSTVLVMECNYTR